MPYLQQVTMQSCQYWARELEAELTQAQAIEYKLELNASLHFWISLLFSQEFKDFQVAELDF